MKAGYRHSGMVHNGKFIPAEPSLFKKQFEHFEGKSIYVIVKRELKQRSIKQNKYLWKVPYTMIAEASGMTIDEVHVDMCAMHLAERVGDRIHIRSTTNLSTTEMSEYFEKLIKFGDDFFGITIPPPKKMEV